VGGSPFISVIIPLFNKRNTLARAIESVLNQTVHDFDLVVVDDGSTDGSADIANAYTDRRLRVVTQANLGVSAARNRGVDLARADYVCFLDADDEWDADFLKRVGAMISFEPSAAIYSTRFNIVNKSGRTQIGTLALSDRHFGVVPDFIDAYRHSQSLVCSSSVCVRKDALFAVGGFPEAASVGEDVTVWLLLSFVGKAVFDARVLSSVHQDAANRTVDRKGVSCPYFLVYFLDGDGKSKLLESSSLRSFVSHYCIVYSAEAVIRGNRSLAQWYAGRLWEHDKMSSIACANIGLTPRWVIESVKKARTCIASMRWKQSSL
jgi:glycosyltransferase involved in cell wall biosynthesis